MTTITSSPALSRARKLELLGLFFISLAVMLALSFLSYHPADNRLAADAFALGSGPAHNAVGLVGAGVAYWLVPGFGYAVLLPVALLFYFGYRLLRKRTPERAPLLAGAVVVDMLATSCLLGWLGLTENVHLALYGGAAGTAMAAWLIQVLGVAGSVVCVLSIHLACLLISIPPTPGGFRATLRRRGRALQESLDHTRRRLARSLEPRPLVPAFAVMPAEVGFSEPEVRFVDTPTSSPSVPRAGVRSEVRPAIAHRATSPEVTPEAASRRLPLHLLDAGTPEEPANREHHAAQERDLLDALRTFRIEIDTLETVIGPTVTRYELGLAPGVKISSIRSLRDDLAMAMAAPSLRMIAPIPGKSAIGVEVPNRSRELVRVGDLIGSDAFSTTKHILPLVLGKTIEGEVFVDDLTSMPHLLIAGATGAGKSVGLNSLIVGLLYALPPESLKFVFIDPKKIELQVYARLIRHYLAVDPDQPDMAVITEVDPALNVLQRCEREMEDRYDRLARAGVRSMAEYNARCRWGGLLERDGHRPMPYLVVVIDELADLMLSSGRAVEAPIARLAQMARAVGIHLIVATQRPSVDVVTGLIKANFPARIAYQVATKVDSRTILDQNGAEELVGRGDLLYMKGSRLIRLQGPFVDLDEIERVTDALLAQPAPGPYLLPSAPGQSPASSQDSIPNPGRSPYPGLGSQQEP